MWNYTVYSATAQSPAAALFSTNEDYINVALKFLKICQILKIPPPPSSTNERSACYKPVLVLGNSKTTFSVLFLVFSLIYPL
jgi:hypothetical protein